MYYTKAVKSNKLQFQVALSWSFCTIIMLVMKANASIFYDIADTTNCLQQSDIQKLFVYLIQCRSLIICKAVLSSFKEFRRQFLHFYTPLTLVEKCFWLNFHFAILNYPWDLCSIYPIPLNTKKTIVNLLILLLHTILNDNISCSVRSESFHILSMSYIIVNNRG